MARLIVAILLSVLTASLPASAVEYFIGDDQVIFPTPSGYCELDKSNELEAAILNAMKELQAPRNKVAAQFVECGELSRLRARLTNEFTQHGMFLVQVDESTGLPYDMHDISPSAFVSEISRNMKSDFPIDDVASDIGEKWRKWGAKHGADVDLGETKMGLIGSDEDAVYLALAQNPTVDGAASSVAGVVAIQLVKGRMVSSNIYAPYENEQTFSMLEERARRVAAEIRKVNGSTSVNEFVAAVLPSNAVEFVQPASGSDVSFDWAPVLDRAVPGAVVGGLLAVLVFGGQWLVGILRRRKEILEDSDQT